MSRFLIPGWRFVDLSGPAKQLIVVGYPHTSRRDFVLAQAARFRKGRDMLSLVAETEFYGLRGAVLRMLGCMPVPRASGAGLTDEIVKILAHRPQTSLGICPEAGIEWRSAWRTGYWVIAMITGIPVCYVSFDYLRRCVILHEPVQMTGDPEVDLAHARSLYSPVTALRPDDAAPIVFSEAWCVDLHRMQRQRQLWAQMRLSSEVGHHDLSAPTKSEM
ncbi:MAG: hypothetical protein RI884_2589 [Pseudomonadota bacterium]|jgi:1-acyl-sn-glycerol-3-phosphate acyltransferase